ncbi:Type IV secretory pathway, VirD4 component, TraG/TraD family ATPase [Parafrankia irregularis]|uniref:Type IV secretory pathway, VirD4 component, TraG/TraD family ATPase n=1 Tax=Parafrankia irregularis TaxID=795642 RepID=A0A0S4QYZ7_9ACTN|nr:MULTISPECIES: TraM recognition domain-containing protein [Parafrankia]MBE3206672.1 TraM recognition domain-containing protein [Parafrankia sp. CH37]CUU60765.1 Type IV secretory pathway, VirD4 component, TraG/TraD family ATPase [Parafrankia irregularis]
MQGPGSSPGGTKQGLLLPLSIIGAGAVYYLWRVCARLGGPGGYVLFAILLLGATGLFALAVLALRRLRGDGSARVRRDASARAVTARAAHLRPDLGEAATAIDAAIRLGFAGASAVHATVEDGCLIVGPARSGKTRGLLAGAVVDWPGPVVATSIRPDLAAWTAAARAREHGPVWVWNPWQPMPPVGQPLRWDPTGGADDPSTALRRGQVLASAAQIGAGTENGSDWQQVSAIVLAAYLHAAALSGASMRDVLAWSSDPADPTPVTAIRRAGLATQAWAESLARYSTEDPRMQANIFFGVRLALASLWDPVVLDAACPPPGTGFEIVDLLAGGTVHIQGTPASQQTIGPLTALLVDEIVEAGLQRAATSPGGRLAPPLGLMLDEASNIAALPRLPDLFSYGGGSGVFLMAVLQSLNQARRAWGEHAAKAMWDAATYKLILPGVSDVADLEDLSKTAGEFDEPTASVYTRGGLLGGASAGPDQISVSPRRRRVLEPDEIRNAPLGNALLLPRSAPPTWIRLQQVDRRRDGARLRADHDAYYPHGVSAP